MSNRDYYGDNVPSDLAHNNTSTHSSFNYTPQAGSQEQQIQPQYHQYEQATWPADSSRQDTYDPNSKLNTTLPEGQGEDERGLGSTVVGGAGGAFVGHAVGKKSDHGTLGAIGGAVAGAIAANMASNMLKQNNGHGHGQGHGGHGIVGSMRERRRERLERRLDRLS
ncbi:hypothetical protein BJX62DRAFT_241674 [Aspergillus germanicus]